MQQADFLECVNDVTNVASLFCLQDSGLNIFASKSRSFYKANYITSMLRQRRLEEFTCYWHI